MVDHVVKPGECLASIAKKYGLSEPDKIYQHESNVQLKQRRPNMHLLMPGDVVVIPPKQPKTITLNVGKASAIMVKGKVSKLIITLQATDGSALANADYLLDIGGRKYASKTNEKGKLIQIIDASASAGVLIVYLDPSHRNALQWTLEIGHLDPLPHLTGVQARLNNLGYKCANENGELEDTTKSAILSFKKDYGLTANDDIDSVFVDKLQSVAGC